METISAYFPSPIPTDGETFTPPGSVEFFPPGKHTIVAEKNGKPFQATLTVDESTVERLNNILLPALEAAKAGAASRPFIDFDHDAKEAAAIPVRFFWDNGVRLEIEWTAAGKASLAGRNHSYFSPTFYLDAKGHVSGIPAIGPIGGLVNTPAFQTIERLAASNLNHKFTMEEIDKVKASLAQATSYNQEIKAQLKEQSETVEKLKADKAALEASLQDAESKLSTAESQIEAARKSAIEKTVDEAIQAGRAAKEGKDALVTACLASSDDGKGLIAALPVVKANHPLGIDPSLAASNPGKTKTATQRALEIKQAAQ